MLTLNNLVLVEPEQQHYPESEAMIGDQAIIRLVRELMRLQEKLDSTLTDGLSTQQSVLSRLAVAR